MISTEADSREGTLEKSFARRHQVRPLSSKNKYNANRVSIASNPIDSATTDYDGSISSKPTVSVQPLKESESVLAKHRWTVGSEPIAEHTRITSFSDLSPNSYSADVRSSNQNSKAALMVRRLDVPTQSSVGVGAGKGQPSLDSTKSNVNSIPIKDRLVTIMNRKSPKIISRVLLNVNPARNIDSLIKELGDCVQLANARVLYAANGQQVISLKFCLHFMFALDQI